MNCYRVFLKKEIKEILNSRRLVVSLLFGILCCLVMNFIATMPGSTPLFSFDIMRGILCVNYLVIAMCTDIVYITMVEEVSFGTLDIILLSKCKKSRILLLKCLLPILVSLILFVMNILLNNVCTLWFPQLIFLSADGWYFLFAVVTSIGCNMAEFCRCCNVKSTIPSNNNFLAFAVGGSYALLYYGIEEFGNSMFVIAILLTSLIYVHTYNILEKNKSKTINTNDFFVFNIVDGYYVKTIFSRELKRFLQSKKDIARILYYFVVMIVIYISMPEDIYKNMVICALTYVIAIIFSGNIYLESIKAEVYENMNDILALARISRRKNYKYMMISSLLSGWVIGCLCYIVLFCLHCMSVIKLLNVKFYILYCLILSISEVFAYIISLNYFHSIKASKMVKRYLYIATIPIYCCMCYLII